MEAQRCTFGQIEESLLDGTVDGREIEADVTGGKGQVAEDGVQRCGCIGHNHEGRFGCRKVGGE